MIAQILKRDFLFRSMKWLKDCVANQAADLASGDKDASKDFEKAELRADDLADAAESLQIVLDRESSDSAKPVEGIEQVSFFPRDPIISLAQSVLTQFYEERKSELIQQATGERTAFDDDEIAVTDRVLVAAEDDIGMRDLFKDFEPADIRWASTLIAMAIRKLRGRRRFNPIPSEPLTIRNNARVIVMSDWGTGLPRARKVSAVIRNLLLQGKDENREQHVIHLGDVYYSGWKREYKNNFLPYWPVQEGEEDKFTSWSLNSNHDMYSGGQGYYDYLLKDRRFKRQQQSSYFSLKNDHWHILGLDTGYKDFDLAGDQAQWVQKELSADRNKKGILLSHHQMFSLYESGGEKIEQKLQTPLDEQLIRAWFWGHEHRCAIYKPQKKVQFARCIGHGGVPVYTSSGRPPEGVIYEYQDGFNRLLESWAYFGFAVLDFEDANMHVRYINENGQEHYKETISKS